MLLFLVFDDLKDKTRKIIAPCVSVVNVYFNSWLKCIYMGGSSGGGGGGGGTGGPDTPWKITKIQGFLAILMQDLLKITKLPSHHSNVGHYRHASKMPFQWRFAGGLMMAHFSGIVSISLSHQQQQQQRKNSVLDPLWQNFLDLRMIYFMHTNVLQSSH